MEHSSETDLPIQFGTDLLHRPTGRYIETFDEFNTMCTEKNQREFIFEKIDPDYGIQRESRGTDGIITSVPFGKPVTHTYTPLSDSPHKRFFINVLTNSNKVSIDELHKEIANLEQHPTESHKEIFNYLRWHVDTTDQSLNWTITHVFFSRKNKLYFNSPTNGFRIYLIQ